MGQKSKGGRETKKPKKDAGAAKRLVTPLGEMKLEKKGKVKS